MQYRIAVVHDTPHMTWSVRQLFRRIIEKGHSPYYLRITSVPYMVKGGLALGDEAPRLDGCIIKGLGDTITPEDAVARLGIVKSLELAGCTTLNSYEGLLKSRDKISQLMYLSENGIPVPETIVTWSISTALRYLARWGRAIVKPVIGSLGRGVLLLEDEDLAFYELSRIVRTGHPIYLQKYIEKPGRDIRIFVVGNTVLGGIYRVSMGWKTNVARGGKPVKAEVDDELARLALKSAAALGLEYAGVDVAEDTDTDRYLVLEVNSAPLWRGFQAATGIDPSEHIVSRIIDLISEKHGDED